MLRVAFSSSFALVVASVTLSACSGGVATGDPFSTTDGAGKGGSSGSATPTSPAEGSGATPDARASLDVAGVTKALLSDGYCGGAPGKCYGGDAVEIDLEASTVTRRSCVEGGVDPDTNEVRPTTSKATTRALTAEEAKRVRDALATVRFTDDVSKSWDGYMAALTVTSRSGEQRYSPGATCNQASFKTIVAGFEAVSTTFRGL